VNAAIVHRQPFARVEHLLPKGMGEAGWEAIRPNLAHISEAAEWWGVVTGHLEVSPFTDDDRAFLVQAADSLAVQDWGDDPWRTLTNTLKEATGRKGKALFLPLRQALTGRDHGPDMAALLPLIGREAALERLRKAAS
jgi:glutamyl-tRNA synthetase